MSWCSACHASLACACWGLCMMYSHHPSAISYTVYCCLPLNVECLACANTQAIVCQLPWSVPWSVSKTEYRFKSGSVWTWLRDGLSTNMHAFWVSCGVTFAPRSMLTCTAHPCLCNSLLRGTRVQCLDRLACIACMLLNREAWLAEQKCMKGRAW